VTDTGYETRTFGPLVNQAGVRSSPDRLFPQVFEAVVLAVYYTDEETRLTQSCITCDVRLLGRQSRVLTRVPVLQMVHGLWDEETAIPRPMTQNTEGGTLQTGVAQPTTGVEVTPAEVTDGDHVLIGFLEGLVNRPFIWPVMVPHPRAKHMAKNEDGRVRRSRHHGVLVEVDKQGNYTIDARGACKEELGPSGAELPNLGPGGTVTVLAKTAAGLEAKVKLDAASGKVTVESGVAVEVTAPSVVSTGTGGVPDMLVKWTALAGLMNALDLAAAQAGLPYVPGGAPIVSPASFLALCQAVSVAAKGWALATAHTTVTKAG